MNDLDTLARHHAEVLRDSVGDVERPELLTRHRSEHSHRGIVVAAIAAAIAVAVIAPLALRRGNIPPADTVTTTVTPTTGPATTTTLSSSAPEPVAFDLQRFAIGMLNGAFGEDEDRIGAVVIAPSGSDLSDWLSALPELDDYVYLPPEVVAASAADYPIPRSMESLQGDWQAYGLIPQYSGTPVWEWEPTMGTIPDAAFATNPGFENPNIRVPDGWSVVARLDSELASGTIKMAVDTGIILLGPDTTTLLRPDGSTLSGEPPPLEIEEACCGSVIGYEFSGGILLLEDTVGWLMDTSTLTWRQIDPLPAVALRVGADVYPLGSAWIGEELFVVIRARAGSGPASAVAALDPAAGTWRVIDPVPSGISRGGVTTDGTHLIVAGVYQDYNNMIVGGRNPAAYTYTDTDGWSELPSIPIDGQASTITWIDDADGMLAWNYDQESAWLDDTGTWRRLDDVPMESGECLPNSVAVGQGAAGVCGGFAWFDTASQSWRGIEAPRNAALVLADDSVYAIVVAAGEATVLTYSLPTG